MADEFTPNAHYTHPDLATIFQAIPAGKSGEWLLKDINRSAEWVNRNGFVAGILDGVMVADSGIWKVCYNVIGGNRSLAAPKEKTAYKPAEFVPCGIETVTINGENWLGREAQR